MIAIYVFAAGVVHLAYSEGMQKSSMTAIFSPGVVLICVSVAAPYVQFHIISDEQHFEKNMAYQKMAMIFP
jgi:Na+/proline symporter